MFKMLQYVSNVAHPPSWEHLCEINTALLKLNVHCQGFILCTNVTDMKDLFNTEDVTEILLQVWSVLTLTQFDLIAYNATLSCTVIKKTITYLSLS